MTSPQKQLLYFADPMCSWCWGFSPVMQSVIEHSGDRLAITPVLGGLAANTTEAMDARTKSSIRQHWDHVHELSGQPFNYEFFDREEFIYNTALPCQAVVAARQLTPQRTLPFLADLHAAFYRDNRDITDFDTLCDVAGEFDLDREKFAQVLAADATTRETLQDFSLAGNLGIGGFPTLLGDAEGSITPISIGYRPWEQIQTALDDWLANSDAKQSQS